jgi:3-hydroxybutyryl-CoA dehydrogenase
VKQHCRLRFWVLAPWGQGIAQICAGAGHETRLYDLDRPKAQGALKSVRASLDKLVDKGRVTDDVRRTTLGNLTIGFDVNEVCRGVTFVIEAIVESMDAKVALLAPLVSVAPEHAVFASNTSSLSITELGQKIGAAARTIGTHFFNPAPMMDLVEVVRGMGTSEETLQTTLALIGTLKKTPIVIRDVPGFATSRLGVLLGAEAMRMVESGVASAEDIDTGMELGYRHPMGPLKLTDVVGLDVRLSILEHLHRELGEQFRPPALLRQMVRAGKLGKKTGEGFYLWVDGKPVSKLG